MESYRLSYIVSAVGHLCLFLTFVFVVELLPASNPVLIGTGPGGGQGNSFVTVGLLSEASGGTGMYKPSIVPKPEALLPAKESVPESETDQETFEQKSVSKMLSSKPRTQTPTPGTIPQIPEAGSGGARGGEQGAGGGFGGGQGVTIGAGVGQGVMNSWYVRQVEQRVGQNWLKTSLGPLAQPVQTTISFEISSNGNIGSIAIEQKSGIRSVDLAAERAVQASGPLPPLPSEFRQKRVTFVAHFKYPPR